MADNYSSNLISAPIARVLVVEDDRLYSRLLQDVLSAQGYKVKLFDSATELLENKHELETAHLVISDIKMPGHSGYDLCRAIRANDRLGRLPIILVTGNSPEEKAKGIEAGADEFIGKPFRAPELLAKIRSLIKIRGKEVATARELKVTKGMNDRLQRFVSPNVADLLTLESLQPLLKPHRTEVSVFFVDLRRFTAFAERSQPEDVLEVLSGYYTAVGRVATKYRGTLGHLAGDGIMVFFNDPEPMPHHRELAVQMAIEVREELLILREGWKAKHFDIDFGIGVNSGVATLGAIGFEQFSQYTVIGPVSNIAARLCNAACEGQILAPQVFLENLAEDTCVSQCLGQLLIKGVEKPLAYCNVLERGTRRFDAA